MARKFIQSSLNSGELTPRLDARTDLSKFYNGATQMSNAIPLKRGGAIKRPGGMWIAKAKGPCALMPFSFSADDSMILELGNQYARFFKNEDRVMEDPVTITDITVRETPAAPAKSLFRANGTRIYSYTSEAVQREFGTDHGGSGINGWYLDNSGRSSYDIWHMRVNPVTGQLYYSDYRDSAWSCDSTGTYEFQYDVNGQDINFQCNVQFSVDGTKVFIPDYIGNIAICSTTDGSFISSFAAPTNPEVREVEAFCFTAAEDYIYIVIRFSESGGFANYTSKVYKYTYPGLVEQWASAPILVRAGYELTGDKGLSADESKLYIDRYSTTDGDTNVYCFDTSDGSLLHNYTNENAYQASAGTILFPDDTILISVRSESSPTNSILCYLNSELTETAYNNYLLDGLNGGLLASADETNHTFYCEASDSGEVIVGSYDTATDTWSAAAGPTTTEGLTAADYICSG